MHAVLKPIHAVLKPVHAVSKPTHAVLKLIHAVLKVLKPMPAVFEAYFRGLLAVLTALPRFARCFDALLLIKQRTSQ